MRFRVMIEGEHGNGLEWRERFQGFVDRFLDALHTAGFHADLTDWTLAHREPEVFVTTAPPTSGGGGLVEFYDSVVHPNVGDGFVTPIQPNPLPPAEVVAPPANAVFAQESSEAVHKTDLSDAALRAAIRRLKKELGGNKILSQEELAERLGVSRHRIRKVLG